MKTPAYTVTRVVLCGRENCLFCNPRPIHAEPHRETLAELLLATAAIVIFGIAALVLWPLVAAQP